MAKSLLKKFPSGEISPNLVTLAGSQSITMDKKYLDCWGRLKINPENDEFERLNI